MNKRTIQVLVASMNQEDYSLPTKMNLQSDAIIGNQCDRNEVEQIKFGNNKILYLNFNERGVGLNRNNALMRASSEICLLADDDMRYVDGYCDVVNQAFDRLPDADVIIFNLHEIDTQRYVIKKIGKVNHFNYLRYGAARVAFKLDSIRLNGIYFNQCFGGGTKYSHGEDNIFLSDCLKKGLKIYAYPAYIADLSEERESTWNKGYDEKYLHDQGILYKTISRRYWKLLCLQDAIRHSKIYCRPFYSSYKMMVGRK